VTMTEPRNLADVADAVPETDEPPLCPCRRHYLGAPCPVPFLSNVGAVIRDRGPYDGKRGTLWTPAGAAFYDDLQHYRHDEPPHGLTISVPGTVTRNGDEVRYSEALRVRFSRWWTEREGCHWHTFPPAMPDTARENIGRAVDDAVRDALSAVLGVLPSTPEHFDAIYREAARLKVAYEAERERRAAAEAIARAEAIEARLADPAHVPFIRR
jgi:hypothetical protein